MKKILLFSAALIAYTNMSYAKSITPENWGVSCKRHYFEAGSVKGLTLEITDYYNCETGKLMIREKIYHWK